jgi:retron-type reverse transcriptase
MRYAGHTNGNRPYAATSRQPGDNAPIRVYVFKYSFGFQPERNTLQAVQKSLDYINSGYQHIVDIDLKGFFDEVDHCLL